MNILLIIDNLGSGGAQNQITLLAKGLKSIGHNITVFTYYPQDFFRSRLDDNNIEIVSTMKKSKSGFNVIRSLINLVVNKDINTIISFLNTPNLYSAITKFKLGDKIRFIASYRSMTNFNSMSRFSRLFNRFVIRKADIVVANSHHERKRWQQNYSQHSEKWNTIYNAVLYENDTTFDYLLEQKKSILVVGSVGPAKNGLLLVEALNMLKQEGIKINVTWVGQKVLTIPARKEYVLKMEQKLEENKLDDQWMWLKPTQNIYDIYKSHEVLLLASVVEGLPNVVCEAMTVGMPIIISDVLDHSKLVENNKNGFLFDPNSVESLVDALKKFSYLNKDERSRFGSYSMRKAKTLFSFDRYISEFNNLIENSN